MLVVHHANDPHCAENVDDYKLQVTDKAAVQAADVGTIVDTLRPLVAGRPDQEKWVNDFRLTHHPGHFALTQRIADLKKQIDEADLSIPITLVMDEMAEPRPT